MYCDLLTHFSLLFALTYSERLTLEQNINGSYGRLHYGLVKKVHSDKQVRTSAIDVLFISKKWVVIKRIFRKHTLQDNANHSSATLGKHSQHVFIPPRTNKCFFCVVLLSKNLPRSHMPTFMFTFNKFIDKLHNCHGKRHLSCMPPYRRFHHSRFHFRVGD